MKPVKRSRPESGPIVSSAHLVSAHSAEMSEFEFGLIVTHRARDKRLADICFIMNVEDTHLVNYSLKKLQALGVVQSTKSGKEVTYAATDQGRAYVQRYREIRESCLIDALNADESLNRDIGELARLLRVLAGMYDQAARAAASL